MGGHVFIVRPSFSDVSFQAVRGSTEQEHTVKSGAVTAKPGCNPHYDSQDPKQTAVWDFALDFPAGFMSAGKWLG